MLIKAITQLMLNIFVLFSLSFLASPSFSQSNSQKTGSNIPIPADAKISMPLPGESSKASAFLGAWMGDWYSSRSGFGFQHMLVVERIVGDKAEVIYATPPVISEARTSVARWVRLNAKLDGDALYVPISKEITARYTLSDENELSGRHVFMSLTMQSKAKRVELNKTKVRDMVPLPEDFEEQWRASTANAAAPTSGFFGAWSGWWGGSRPHILIVTKMEGDNADAIYAWGQQNPPTTPEAPGWRKVTGKVIDNTLILNMENGASVRYKIDDAGNLDATYLRNGNTSRASLSALKLD